MKRFTRCALSLLLAAVFAVPCVGFSSAAELTGETLRFNADGKFKIMLVADVGDIPNTRESTRRLLEAGIDEQSPDLVVYLGNVTSLNLGDTGDFLNKARFKTALDNVLYPTIDAGIPYAVVFGANELYKNRRQIMSLETQSKYIREYPLCLNPEYDSSVLGNFNLAVAPSSGEGTAVNFYFFNTVKTSESGGNTELKDWYLNTSESLERANGGKVDSVIFGYNNVSQIAKFFSFDGSGFKFNDKLFDGYGDRYPELYNDFYADIKARGDVFSIVSGADDRNCFSGKPDGMGYICAGDSGFLDTECADPSVTFMTLDGSDPRNYTTVTRTYSDYFGADALAEALVNKNYSGNVEEIGGFFKTLRSAFRHFFTAFSVVRRKNDVPNNNITVPAAPTNIHTPTPAAPLTPMDGDYYVSPSGNDGNDGSKSAPFRTIERARDAVRELKRTSGLPVGGVDVCLMAGEYRTDGITFTAEDSGTASSPITYRAYGDGEVVINGGVSLDGGDFAPISGKEKSRLFSWKAKRNVVMLDLAQYGITAEDYGKIYAIGSYNSGSLYDGGEGPIYSELFVNDKRMTLARYPNGNEFLNIGRVLDEGATRDNSGGLYDSLRNPPAGTFKVDLKTASHITRYATLDDVWVMGYFRYDWADSSTPIASFNPGSRSASMKYSSGYGYVEGAPYYIFNALEELDTPGEWYLDRDSGIIYLYAPCELDGAQIDLSLTTNPLITVNGANNLTFKNITVKGTRGDAMILKGNSNTVDACLIKNVSGGALRMDGFNNRAVNNEITRTGKGGIYLTGGNTATLTPGNNIAYNNLIHDWSEIYLTYQPGVTLGGVGNVCSRNEMYNSPHEAITFHGNNHIIEYNYLHDVVLQSSDAGAIYSGRRWDFYGNVIRYNCITNLGSGDFTPCGIYMDDGLSGQTIYGNFLMNIPGIGLHLGGGRDLKAYNNIVLNAGTPISYDERARDGALNVGSSWAAHFFADRDVWLLLKASPWQTPEWRTAFPDCAAISDDFNDAENPLFGANPANSEVINNIIITNPGQKSNIALSVYRFSDLSPNAYFAFGEDAGFTDTENGIYTLRPDAPAHAALESFDNLPFGSMGRR